MRDEVPYGEDVRIERFLTAASTETAAQRRITIRALTTRTLKS
jgi:hypothetical protein